MKRKTFLKLREIIEEICTSIWTNISQDRYNSIVELLNEIEEDCEK